MRICVLGSGFVESHLPDSYQRITERVEPASDCVSRILDSYHPDVLINCIAKTGRPNIDWCESHKEETMLANVTLPTLLAEATSKRGIQLVQIGSGCIFYGDSPHTKGGRDPGWRETDGANPKSYYSKTKLSCDLAIQDFDNVCILRIRMPISKRPSNRDYLSKIVKYQRVIDAPNSMTFMDDLVRGIQWAIDNRKRGLYHLTNPGAVSPIDFLNEYRKYHPDHAYEIITAAELDNVTVAPRSNCIIDSSKIQREGFDLAPAQELVEAYVRSYVEHNR